MKKSALLLLVYPFLFIDQANTQTFTNYTTESTRLFNNFINSIVIDTKGNKWFGTDGGGVTKFDGTNWTTYNTSDGLISNEIHAIAIDIQGNKWFGTDEGVSKFDGTNWTTYTTSDGLVGNYVRSIAIDMQGNKWFVTYDGVSKFDGTNWTTYTNQDGLAGNNVRAIAIDKEGNKWFGTNLGVSKFDDTLWTNYTISDGLVSSWINAITIDAEGNKWFGTNEGVSKFDDTTWTTYTTLFGLISNEIHVIAIDAEGNKWFGTNGGVSKFDDTTWITYDTLDGLVSNYVVSIIIDVQGNKWFGTDQGVAKFDDIIWTIYTTSDGLAGDYVWAIAIDGEGNKWFGTNEGVSKFDGSNWITYTTSDGLICNEVHAVAIDAESNKWFGTFGGGVTKFDGTNWTNYTTSDGLVCNYVYAIAIDAENNKWFGGITLNDYGIIVGGGVSKFDGTNWTTYTTADGLANDFVTAIAIDGEGNKWFGTNGGGVSKFDDTTWTTYTENILTVYMVHAIAIDEEGNKWFGIFGGGVSKFDDANWTTYTWENGLADNNVRAIAIDEEGNKWFGTDFGGVSKFDGKTWTTYTTSDGLVDNFVTSIAIDAEGNKWFGTFGGGFGGGVSKLSSDLVGWWPLNGNANDESGNGNNGTVNGATLTLDRFGKFNRAYLFDGIDDYIEISPAASINTATMDKISISIWGKISILNDFNRFFTFSNKTEDVNLDLTTNDNKILFINYPYIGVYSKDTISINEWYHIVATMDFVKKTAYLYIDGKLVNSGTGNVIHKPIDPYVRIGRAVLNSEWPSFNGVLDDMRVYNRALNESEVRSLYHKGNWANQANIRTFLDDKAVCKNDSVVLDVIAVGTPSIHYQWQKDGADITGAINCILTIAQVQPEDAGEYRCIASNSYGIDISNSAMLWVEFATPTDIHGITYVPEYQVANYSIEIQQGHTYEFLVDGGNRIDSTENGITVHWGKPGQGYVKLIETSEIGCDVDTNILKVTIGSTGIKDQLTQNLLIYPNPVKDNLIIKCDDTTLTDISISLVDVSGRCIIQREFDHIDLNEEQVLDLSSIKSGLYFLEIRSEKNSRVYKIIKE